MLLAGVFGIIVVLLCLGVLVSYILYLVTLHTTLDRVSPANRKMSPGQVWMVFIPIFGIVWHFIMVGYIADSLAAEFRSRNIQVAEARPGYGIGLAYCICLACCIIPFLNILAILGFIICMIVYWAKIAEYKKMLAVPAQNGILDAHV
jgi:hypothetical protein